ncbi:beta-ketoacyl-ACP synthase II [Litorilinea aerophila]|uniref:3-oxoacyl-[acyl-carrier-protein] synthase 2 n=1 Tax=Litorilinea aerophila TaxID=1204385 RepID=A0A540VMM2_9CHLR|nr:beta-ketoacyl-ACP synthase II [Litorilinea aerophila]MCC9075067.1 beta-ketoacyl-ACP synthase II [Litorilinea aerophila]GIV79854.1 MAG: 3-oxoacyl-[acyl-carrier-protein] synthase 2 [Litorilinea sp.]
MTRVFVTGLGAISPIGNDVETYWQNLLAGKSGAGRVMQFDPGDMPYNIACEVKDFDPADYMDRKLIRRTSRSTQFAIAASKQALADAGLVIDETNRDNVGVMMATGGGGFTEIEAATITMMEKGWRSVGPFVVPNAMSNAVSCLVSIETGARGPVMTSTAACASGHYSIIEGYHFLQRGEADVIIAGGTESAISLLTMSAFGRMGPLSSRTDDPEHACRPFSIDRDGFVSGEGACVLILETEEHARRRGARIYAEVLGGRLTGDAYHITAPDPEGDGAARALVGAVKNARLRPEDIDVVYAHGTGTVLNDIGEAKALKRAFGEHVYDMKITSIKSMIGHGLGAAGAQSAVAAVLTLRHGIVPPTINYTPDPEIDIPIVGNVAQEVDARYAIVNAFGFGGQNVVAVFGRVDE